MIIKNSFESNPISNIDEDIKKWVFSREVFFDNKEKCSYCGRRSQNMCFKIINKMTESNMMIGSNCLVNLFKKGLTCLDNEGNSMTLEELRRFISDCRYHQKNEKRKINTMKCLGELSKRCDIGLIIEEFEETGFFDVCIALYLIEEFRRFNITYDKKMFKINISREIEKENFLSLSKDQYKLIKHSLNSYQKQRYEERF